MITVYKVTTSPTDGKAIMELRGKSTDTKPITSYMGYYIANGSTFYEINSGKLFMFDADAGAWVEQ